MFQDLSRRGVQLKPVFGGFDRRGSNSCNSDSEHLPTSNFHFLIDIIVRKLQYSNLNLFLLKTILVIDFFLG